MNKAQCFQWPTLMAPSPSRKGPNSPCKAGPGKVQKVFELIGLQTGECMEACSPESPQSLGTRTESTLCFAWAAAFAVPTGLCLRDISDATLAAFWRFFKHDVARALSYEIAGWECASSCPQRTLLQSDILARCSLRLLIGWRQCFFLELLLFLRLMEVHPMDL